MNPKFNHEQPSTINQQPTTKILIIGSGGREHAIGWKIKQDNPEVQLYFSKGNGGTQNLGENLDLEEIWELVNFAKTNKIDLTIVGPEANLVEGIVDEFQKENLAIFGPDKRSAMLEGSKTLAKDFMQKHGVKTAQYQNFQHYVDARDYVDTLNDETDFPIVVKASGIAAGKGVLICKDQFATHQAIREIMLDKQFGDAGSEVVIEEFLEGFECSILSIFNGKEITPFISAKDHKKIGEGETGLNTGGMGVLAPNPQFTNEYWQAFTNDILNPTLKGLLAEQYIFSGVIFFGLMITKKGVYLLEYNLRFGDPETQTVLPLLNSNLLEIIQKSVNQESFDLDWKNQHACCVVMASGGYPLEYEKGFEIHGLDNVETNWFIAGAKQTNGVYTTNGGRVLNIVGLGNTLSEANQKAYTEIQKVRFDYNYFRKDIGL